MDGLKRAALVVVLAAVTGCDGGDHVPKSLLHGRRAETLAAVPRSVLTSGREVDAAKLGGRFTSCARRFGAEPGGPVVERVGVVGESLTYAGPRGTTVYACDGGTDVSGESRPPWCGGSVGRLVGGHLLDPRLDVLCRAANGQVLAYAWIDPIPKAHWVGVDQGTYVELYETLGGLPVRVATRRGIDLDRFRASFDLVQVDVAGKLLSRGRIVAAVAG
jgi:hypothetical protein